MATKSEGNGKLWNTKDKHDDDDAKGDSTRAESASSVLPSRWEPPYGGIALRNRENHVTYCCQCRIPEDLPNKIKLFRCSRCKLTQYCSKKCQKQHYRVHKSGCILLHQANNPPGAGTGDDMVQTITNELLNKGDLVFQIAYRSCDTIERGAFMLEQTLDYYYDHLLLLVETATTNPEILEQEGPTFVSFYTSIYDRVRFFLAALGHYDECAIAMGFRSKWDDLSQQLPGSSQTMQMTAGFIKMKLIASLREDTEKLDAFKITRRALDLKGSAAIAVQEGLVGPSNLLAQQEHYLHGQLVTQYSGAATTDDPTKDNFWRILLNRSLFLSESTMPLLFAPDTGHPTELYCFVQDCFFLDPGIHSVLTDLIEWYEME